MQLFIICSGKINVKFIKNRWNQDCCAPEQKPFFNTHREYEADFFFVSLAGLASTQPAQLTSRRCRDDADSTD